MNIKKYFLFVFLFLFFIHSSLAITLTAKSTYQPSETLIAEIQGNILQPIQVENVILKRNNVQVPWEYDVKRINNQYFLYGVVPLDANNYTIHINDITTTVNGRVEEVDFNQTIKVEGQLIAYTISPGFVISEEDFEINIFLNRDIGELVETDFPFPRQINLAPGENNILFSIDQVMPGFKIIKVGIYSVPILILGEEDFSKSTLPKFRFFPGSIEGTILLNEQPSYSVVIINEGDTEIENLIFEYDREFFEVLPVIESVPANSQVGVNLTLKRRDGPFDTLLILKSGDLIIELPVAIEYTENLNEVDSPNVDESSGTATYYCQQLSGKSCTAGDICNGEVVSSRDVTSCCIGTCQVEERSSSYSWVGYLIAAVILIILVFIGGRYLKTRIPKMPKLSS